MKLFAGLISAIVVVLAIDNATATNLGSFTNNVYWYTNSGDYPDTDRGMFYQLGLTDYDILNRIDRPEGTGYMYSEPAFILFAERITSQDIGQTFAINNTNYNAWNQMVEHLLVDGSSMYVCRNQGAIDVFSFPFEWTFTDYYNGNGVDFKSYTIDNLLVTIDDLQIKWFDYGSEYYWSLVSTIIVDGHHGQPSTPVPEPSILLLLGTGLASFVGFGIRKREKMQL